MCIRDSHGNGQPNEKGLHWREIKAPEKGPKDRVTFGEYDCLLYTSDAADDLLCVDLGGRRIIKKKKNQTQSVEHRRVPE